jgi:hypothetical protein
MFGGVLEVLRSRIARDDEGDLRVRIFRMLTATTAVLCLGLILPMNLLQDMPLGLNLLNVAFGLVGAFCCWQSLRGRHHILPFLFAAVLLLDVAWFLNAGSQGSVTFFFFPVLLFAVVMSGGVARFGLVVALILNVSVLFLVEDRFPVLATPFNTPGDRLLDLITGIIAGFAALAVMAGRSTARFSIRRTMRCSCTDPPVRWWTSTRRRVPCLASTVRPDCGCRSTNTVSGKVRIPWWKPGSWFKRR